MGAELAVRCGQHLLSLHGGGGGGGGGNQVGLLLSDWLVSVLLSDWLVSVLLSDWSVSVLLSDWLVSHMYRFSSRPEAQQGAGSYEGDDETSMAEAVSTCRGRSLQQVTAHSRGRSLQQVTAHGR